MIRVPCAVMVVLVCVASAASGQAWPDRLGSSPGVLHEYAGPAAGWYGRTIYRDSTGRVRDDADAVSRLCESIGIDPAALSYEQRSAHIAAVRPPRNGEPGDGFRYAVFASAQPAGSDGARLHRTWFRFRSPDGARGLAVVMPGMLGTPHQFVDRFEQALLGEGWAVLRMLVPPSRSTEHLPALIDIREPEPSIRLLAAELDQRTAECAYAVEAGCEWAESAEPKLVELPRVLIGMSGTGMMASAVLARETSAFDASVIIGSGANAFAILRESSYAEMLDSVSVTWEPAAPGSERLDDLDAMYLRAASLDAYTLAPAVSGVPTLLVHGSADRAVPARTGDLLWERLGRPERWTTPVGHELLFVRTLLQIPEIIRWLNAHTGEDAP